MRRCSPMRHFFFFMTENEEPNQDIMFAEEYCTITYGKKKFTGHCSKVWGGSLHKSGAQSPRFFLKILFMLYTLRFFQTIQVIGGFSLRNKSGPENQRNLAMCKWLVRSNYTGHYGANQMHPMTVFCKISFRTNKYCLEFSINWGKQKNF